MFRLVRSVQPGDRLVASYKELRSELRLPAVHLLRVSIVARNSAAQRLKSPRPLTTSSQIWQTRRYIHNCG